MKASIRCTCGQEVEHITALLEHNAAVHGRTPGVVKHFYAIPEYGRGLPIMWSVRYPIVAREVTA